MGRDDVLVWRNRQWHRHDTLVGVENSNFEHKNRISNRCVIKWKKKMEIGELHLVYALYINRVYAQYVHHVLTPCVVEAFRVVVDDGCSEGGSGVDWGKGGRLFIPENELNNYLTSQCTTAAALCQTTGGGLRWDRLYQHVSAVCSHIYRYDIRTNEII